MLWIDDANLPLVFSLLMAVSLLVYAILDGYDLGVGMLIDQVSNSDKDRMIASIGPFWDCLLYTSPSPRDVEESRMPSSA